jgi:hypothetical protein
MKKLFLSKETTHSLTEVRGGGNCPPPTVEYSVCGCADLKSERVQ